MSPRKSIRVAVLVLAMLALVGTGLAALLQPGAELETSATSGLAGERVRVEVLNGAGVAGLARTATAQLRERDFDVVFFGNAPGGRRDSSLVLDRVGRLEAAARVAAALGIEAVRSEPDSTLYLEVTVILGADWAGSAREAASTLKRP